MSDENNESVNPGNPGSGDVPSRALGSKPGSSEDTSNWMNSVPEEYRANPTIATMKAGDANEAIGLLSKQLVNAEGNLGKDKVLRPQDDWTPEQRSEWNADVLKVPTALDGYKMEALKLPEGITEVPKAFKDAFIESVGLKHGMSDAAATEAMQFVLNSDAQMAADAKAQAESTATQQLNALKTKWGDAYDAQLEVAEYGLANIADPELVKMIQDDPILSTHPLLNEAFHKVGTMLQGDGFVDGGPGGNGNALGSKAQALAAIKELEGSGEYIKYINPKTYLEPAERYKKDLLFKKRTELYQLAYDGEAQEDTQQ
jgi:hypothetical protein